MTPEPQFHAALALASGHGPAQHPRDGDITWLIDNEEAYSALVGAFRSAHTSIWVAQLALDADCVAYLPDEPPAQLSDMLLDAALKRDVDVRILLNASLLLDTVIPLREYVAAAGAGAAPFRIRGISRFPQLLHAKIVIADGETAFLVGSPFANGYWDDSRHAPRDVRRPARELGGRPLHDVTTQLDGPAVAQLRGIFTELWNGADDIAPDDRDPLPDSPPSVHDRVRLVSSAPTPRHSHHPPERIEILDALLAGIEAARRLIYIEHQYLSSIAVINALSAALDTHPALEVVALLNPNPDVTAYRGWQNRRLSASGLLTHERMGLFSLWTIDTGERAGTRTINQIFLHSKVVAVDDAWAMIGSANLDGVSLATYGDDFVSRIGQRVFRGVRNFDVSAVVSEPGGGTSAAVLELRTALWREHLDAPDLDAESVPAEGWLATWRRIAAANAISLRSPAPRPVAGPRILVLPYSGKSSPKLQLSDAGVSFANTDITLCFNPSWAERHLSPNWMRNMLG